MKKFLKCYWRDVAVYALIASCIGYLHLCNGWTSLGIFWLCEFLTFILFDAAVILLGTYVIALGHKKIGYTIGFTLTLFWTLLNVYYHRFFNQYFNFRDFGEAKNFKDGVVWDSVFSAIQVSDIFLLFILALFVLLIAKMKPSPKKFMERFKQLKAYAMLLLVIVVMYGTERTLMDAAIAVKDSKARATLLESWNYMYVHKRNIQHRGLFCGQLYDDAIVKRDDKMLSAEENAFLEQYCSQLCENGKSPVGVSKDSIKKNIIFILLESALSLPIGEIIDGVEVTPSLNALLHEPGTFYNGQCKDNIGIGESFDGQFIYHTGLLPLIGKLTSTYVVNNELKAFPLCMKEKYGIQFAAMAIPTGPGMWRQEEMCRLYGYDYLLSATNTNDGLGEFTNINDSLLINMLVDNRNVLFAKEPFLHTVLTMSMHGPYDVVGYDADMKNISSYPLLMNNYLKHYHYTDRQLGRYFDFLKSKGMYDNSIIIIVSDHAPQAQYFNMTEKEFNLPFIIAHADIDTEKCWQGEMNQLDVFTTLLDLFGIESDWYGLGSSVLDAENYQNRLNETTQKVSDLIIESNYWKSED